VLLLLSGVIERRHSASATRVLAAMVAAAGVVVCLLPLPPSPVCCYTPVVSFRCLVNVIVGEAADVTKSFLKFKFVIVRSQNAITNHKIIDHKIL
jgi:hypothetical protein